MQPPFFTTTSYACSCLMEKLFIAIFWYFVIIILYCKTIQLVIFFSTTYIFYSIHLYILIYNTIAILNWFSLTLQSLNIDFFFRCWTFFPGIAPHISSILLLLYLKQKQHQEHRWFQSYSEKNPYSKIVLFIEIFFRDSRVFLTSSLYRSMWTIGQSQRVEEKKYRPIVRKIRYSLPCSCS